MRFKTCMLYGYMLCMSCKHNINSTVVTQDTANWPATFGLGRPATQEEIARLDIAIRPDGKGLPPGAGDAAAGKTIYMAKCAACHGTGAEPMDVKLQGPVLMNDSAGADRTRLKTIGNYWPYATTIFDYVRRTMPYNAPGTLTDNEVYSLTAYLLHANHIITAQAVMDAATLPKVTMPAKKLFVPDDRHGGPEVR